jgi:GNAT superfamily N-acetyltransferase
MNIHLPEGFIARPASMQDAEQTAALINAESQHLSGIDFTSAKDLENEWQEPNFNLSESTLLVLSTEGRIVGYYEFWDPAPYTVKNLWGRVHPDFTGLGIGSAMLAWAEQKANDAIPKAPAEARVIATAYVQTVNQPGQQLFLQAGYTHVRNSWTMVLDLDKPPLPPTWPEGIQVRTAILQKDERAIYQAVRDSFKDHWGYVERPFEESFERWQYYWKTSPNFDPAFWFLAMDGDEIAAINLCQPDQQTEPGMGWVATLGVRRPWRRRGIAMALLQHSFVKFYQHGCTRAGLGVDAESLTGATRLYEKAGMHSDPKREYGLFEKELRPGINLSTQSLENE